MGQHMLVSQPRDVEAVYARSRDGHPWIGIDLLDWASTETALSDIGPDVIINLAGESRVDVVEQEARAYGEINVDVPVRLSHWCSDRSVRFIQVSSQGVFSGEHPPYSPTSVPDPITAYGRQKARADSAVLSAGQTVARLTFVMGIRPFQGIGRQNPAEQMVSAAQQVQVNDRFFSPLFARDAAFQLWRLATSSDVGVVQIGTPVRTSRYALATWNPWPVRLQDHEVTPVSHNYFKGIAERPRDTTWADGRHSMAVDDGMMQAYSDWTAVMTMNASHRADEIAIFLGIDREEALSKLSTGFGALHAEVAKDFRSANPLTDEELLEWYRGTEAYIWELSAYHLDAGFNYSGMCKGFADFLWAKEVRSPLVLGDGIGDLTIHLRERNLRPTYHDLAGSRTAEFAQFRYRLRFGEDARTDLTESWAPEFQGGPYEAIVALDFYEHVVNVEEWAAAGVEALSVGGYFFAQNAFAIGDDEHGGSIPMHLTRNNRFEHDWIPLLERLGMVVIPESGGWWRKP